MAEFIFKASIFSICAGKANPEFQFCGKPLFSTHNYPEDKDDGEYIIAKEINKKQEQKRIQTAYLIDKNTIFSTDKEDVSSLLSNNSNSIFWIVIATGSKKKSESNHNMYFINEKKAPIKIERAWIVNG